MVVLLWMSFQMLPLGHPPGSVFRNQYAFPPVGSPSASGLPFPVPGREPYTSSGQAPRTDKDAVGVRKKAHLKTP